jgi:hypothetical protein
MYFIIASGRDDISNLIRDTETLLNAGVADYDAK